MGYCFCRSELICANVLFVMIVGGCSYCFENETLIHIVNLEAALHAKSDVKLENDSYCIPCVNITTLYIDGPLSFSFYSEAKNAVTKSTDIVLVDRQLCTPFPEDSTTLFYNVSVLCHDVYNVTACQHRGRIEDECYCDDEDEMDVGCSVFGLAEDIVSTAVYNLVKHLKWKWLLVIFDEENENRARIIQTNAASNIYVFLFRVEQSIDLPNLQQILHRYYTWTHEYKNILVLCSNSTRVSHILYQGSIFDELHNHTTSMVMFSRWMFVTGERVLEENLSWIQLDNVVMAMVPSALPSVPGALRETVQSTMKYLRSKLNMTSTEFNIDTLLSTPSQFIRFLTMKNKCWGGKIYSLLHTENGRQLSQLGFFDITGALHVDRQLFTNERFGFNGRKFRVGTMQWAPYVKLVNENGTMVYGGLCIDLLKELSKDFNFSYELNVAGHNESGEELSNGTWTGLVGATISGKLNLVVAPMFVTADKELVMDFTFPFHNDVNVGVYKMPDPEKSKWLTLVKPFKWEVLLCIGVSLVACTTILTVIEMTHTLEPTKPLGEVFQSCFWYIYGALLSHGCSLDPVTMSGRLLVGFWWIFCVVISASYSGILIAFLTVERQTPPFQTLAQLVAQGDYSWGVLGGSTLIAEYHKSADTDVQALLHGLSDNEQASESMDEHKRRVLQGSYVFFCDKATLVMWTKQHCDLMLLKQSFSPFKFSIGLPKNSPFTELFSKKIMDIQSGGLMEIWKKRWWPKRNMCLDMSKARNRPIQLADLQSIFYAAAIGLTLATIILMIEKLIKCLRRNFEQKEFQIT